MRTLLFGLAVFASLGQPLAIADATLPESKGAARGAPGYLVTNTLPWARVYIDGRDTALSTPIAPRRHLALAPGRHAVMFVTDGGMRYETSVLITSGQESRLIIDLTRSN